MAAQLAKGDKSEPKTGTVIPAEEGFSNFLRMMEDLAELEKATGGGLDTTEADVMAILTADDEETMWEADDLVSIGGKDIAGIEMELIDFVVKYGEKEDIETKFVAPVSGKKMFLLIRSVRLSGGKKLPQVAIGEEFTWNTGAPRVVGKLFWLRSHGHLPGQKAVIESKELGGVKAVIKLKEISARPVQAEAETADLPF